jgi:methionine-gamma-lyase
MSNKFDTEAVHAGYHIRQGPVNPPLEASSTYKFVNCEAGAKAFASPEKEGIYARFSSPTVRALEKKIAKLEHGHDGIATSSGMAAVSAVYFRFLSQGAHVVATASMYGASRTILEDNFFFKKFGVHSTFLDTSNIDKVRDALKIPNTKLLFIETPANPTLVLSDITKLAELAHAAHIPLVVDNTFCSPYLQNPLDFGADIVLHSMTKSIGGHSNAIGGMIVAKTKEEYESLRKIVVSLGMVLSPSDAKVFNDQVKTLGLRMREISTNASQVAKYLRSNALVSWVNAPGVFEQHELIGKGKQMASPGSVITFGLKGGYEEAKKLLDNLEIVTLAVSLGSVESLIEHPASMTHAGVIEKERIEAGITKDLIRFSAGIESTEDIINDFKQAFEKCK